MKKETIEKIVITVLCHTTGQIEHIDSVYTSNYCSQGVRKVDNVIAYLNLRHYAYCKEDIIISWTDYDKSINIWITIHDDDNGVIGYQYLYSVTTENKNQLDITCELMQTVIYTIENKCRY